MLVQVGARAASVQIGESEVTSLGKSLIIDRNTSAQRLNGHTQTTDGNDATDGSDGVDETPTPCGTDALFGRARAYRVAASNGHERLRHA